MSSVRVCIDELSAAVATLSALQSTMHLDAPGDVRGLCIGKVREAIAALGDASAMLVQRIDGVAGITAPPPCRKCRGVGSVKRGPADWELCSECRGERVQRAAP